MISAIRLSSVTTFSEPPVSCDTPPKIAAAISSVTTIATTLSASVLASLLETPSRPSTGAAKCTRLKTRRPGKQRRKQAESKHGDERNKCQHTRREIEL